MSKHMNFSDLSNEEQAAVMERQTARRQAELDARADRLMAEGEWWLFEMNATFTKYHNGATRSDSWYVVANSPDYQGCGGVTDDSMRPSAHGNGSTDAAATLLRPATRDDVRRYTAVRVPAWQKPGYFTTLGDDYQDEE